MTPTIITFVLIISLIDNYIIHREIKKVKESITKEIEEALWQEWAKSKLEKNGDKLLPYLLHPSEFEKSMINLEEEVLNANFPDCKKELHICLKTGRQVIVYNVNEKTTPCSYTSTIAKDCPNK